jgi:hypothetical protein
MEHPVIAYLPKYDHCNHGHNDDYCSHDQPVSRGFSLPRRLHCLLFRVAPGSLCCPSGLFFLLGLLRFRHGLLLCHTGCGRVWLLQSETILMTHEVIGYSASHDALTVTVLADSSPAVSPYSTLHKAASSQASSVRETFESARWASRGDKGTPAS